MERSLFGNNCSCDIKSTSASTSGLTEIDEAEELEAASGSALTAIAFEDWSVKCGMSGKDPVTNAPAPSSTHHQTLQTKHR
jgi:hypothetical protein